MSFETWMYFVDNHMHRLVKLRHEDIDDWLWRDSYDAGVSAETAAERGLVNAGWIVEDELRSGLDKRST